MKKILKASALLLILIMSISLFTACDLIDNILGTGNTDDEWKPTGQDVVFIKKNVPITARILFGTPEEIAKDAANEFKTTLNDSKVGIVNTTASATVMNEDSEIIFGESDRTASIKAKELYDEKKSGLYSWVFYYYDGKLAIYAEDAKSYSLGIEDFFEKFCDGNSITFKDSLADCYSITQEEYDAYLDEL